MMLFVLSTFYATMVLAGYVVELTFGGLGLIPTSRHAKVTEMPVLWNYTTVLNIVALAMVAFLAYLFVRSGALPMLRMMGGTPEPIDSSESGHQHWDESRDKPANPT